MKCLPAVLDRYRPCTGRFVLARHIRTIAYKEFVDIWRDGRFRVAGPLLLLLAIVALIGGWQHASRVAIEHDAARQATRAQWINQPAKNPHSAAHYGIYAFRPQTPLAAVDSGIDPYVGVAAWLEAHRQNEFRFRPAADRASVQRVADMNGAFVLQVLLPLVVIALGFASVAGERESGTLRQLAGAGVSPIALAVGKAIGLAGALGLVMAPTIVLGSLAISWSSVTPIWEADAVRTAALMSVYLLWAALWIGLTVTISLLSSTARFALVVLVAIWMGSVFAAPRTVMEVSSRLYPTPSAASFERALDADLSDRSEVDRRVDQRRKELLARYGVASPADLPVGFAGISFQESEEYANEVFDRHYGRLYDTFDDQNRIVQLAGIVSPAVAIRSLSMALSGSDFAHHRHFASAAEQYRRDLQRTLNAEIVEHQRPGQTYLADPALWARIPEFDYQAPDANWALSTQRVSLTALFGWILALALAIVIAARRIGVVS